MGPKLQDLLALNLSERTWIRNLPNSLAELVREIGLEPTLRIALHFAGTSVHIPDKPYSHLGPSHLIEIIGLDAVEKLCETRGVTNLQISSCLYGKLGRRLRWLSLMEHGATEHEAAQSVGISKSTHYEWKKLYLPERGSKPRAGDGNRFSELKARAFECFAAGRTSENLGMPVTARTASLWYREWCGMQKNAPSRDRDLKLQRDRAFKMFAAGRKFSDVCAVLGEPEAVVRRWQHQYGENSGMAA